MVTSKTIKITKDKKEYPAEHVSSIFKNHTNVPHSNPKLFLWVCLTLSDSYSNCIMEWFNINPDNNELAVKCPGWCSSF